MEVVEIKRFGWFGSNPRKHRGTRRASRWRHRRPVPPKATSTNRWRSWTASTAAEVKWIGNGRTDPSPRPTPAAPSTACSPKTRSSSLENISTTEGEFTYKPLPSLYLPTSCSLQCHPSCNASKLFQWSCQCLQRSWGPWMNIKNLNC